MATPTRGAARFLTARVAEAVKSNGDENHDARDDLRVAGFDAVEAATDADHSHDQRADERSEHRACAACETAAADDDCRDDIELEAVRESLAAALEARIPQG